MRFRIAAFAALFLSAAFAQSDLPSVVSPASPDEAPLLRADDNDALVIRARENLERIRKLVAMGALPLMRLARAQEDVQDALDMSLLKQSLYSKDLLPEQTDQMVAVAQNLVLRRERRLLELQEMVSSGVISRAEAEASAADLERARTELDWARNRANLITQLAENVRIEKAIASVETQAASHPEWAGKIYTRFDGNGVFTPADLRSLELAYATRFSRSIPISADGETALHRSFGFDHRGRIDVALTPDQPEGAWLIRYLESKRIPYFAFRAAVPHKSTGAHIHVGPQSTRLTLSD